MSFEHPGPEALTPELARRIADRHFGVGCDQILLVERARSAGCSIRSSRWTPAVDD